MLASIADRAESHSLCEPGYDPALCAARLCAAEERLRALAYELTLTEARERERIATGLHDDIGQILAMVHYKLCELGLALGDTAGRDAGALLDDARALVRQASAATRSATFDLCNPVLRQLGFKAAIEGVAQQVARAAGLQASVSGSPPAPEVPEPVLAVVFRVAREMLFNVQKHAAARQVAVSMSCTPYRLEVCISDDGRGFEVDRPAQPFSSTGGYGLMSAEAQMRALGGRLEIQSAPGQGTCAALVLPMAGLEGKTS